MLSINEPLQLQAPGWHRAGDSVRTGRAGEGVAAADGWQADTLLPGTWAGTASLLAWAPGSALPCNLHAGFFLQDSDSHSGRPVLYQMLAQHSYLAQGPGDLEFSKGDVLDVLAEGSSPLLLLGQPFGLCCGQALGKMWPLQCCLTFIHSGVTGLHWVLPRLKFQP